MVMRWDLSGVVVLELDDMHRVRRVDERRWDGRRVLIPRPRVMVEDEIQVMVGGWVFARRLGQLVQGRRKVGLAVLQ